MPDRSPGSTTVGSGSERPWPAGDGAAPFDLAQLPADESEWPWVAIVTSGAGADTRSVRTLVDAGVEGIVVAATGNGTLHRALEAPLREAAARGCAVLRATRCLAGAIVEPLPGAADACRPPALSRRSRRASS